MQTVSLETLQQWIQTNPHRGTKRLTLRDTDRGTATDPSAWQTVSISPATPLSCILTVQDPMYTFLHPNSRPSHLRAKCTELETCFPSLLKGRQFPVRRTADAIVASSMGGPSACSVLGWKAMAGLFESQIVWFDEPQKLLKFYPEEVESWDAEKPILFCSHLANQVWVPPSDFHVSQFSAWLAEKEQEGWRVSYDEAEGTMEELHALAKQLNVVPGHKMNKAELQRWLGRARAIRHLGTWSKN